MQVLLYCIIIFALYCIYLCCEFIHYEERWTSAIARAPVHICDVNPEQPTDLFCFKKKKKSLISIFYKKWAIRVCVCVCVWGGGG